MLAVAVAVIIFEGVHSKGELRMFWFSTQSHSFETEQARGFKTYSVVDVALFIYLLFNKSAFHEMSYVER